METVPILIKTRLSPKVLERLEENKVYFCCRNWEPLEAAYTGGLIFRLKETITHIYLPKEITLSDIEKEVENMTTFWNNDSGQFMVNKADVINVFKSFLK